MPNFLPHTDADRQAMLATIGVQSLDTLFCDVPESLKTAIQYHFLPQQGLSELELEQKLKKISSRNTGHEYACFLGGGAYARYIPPAVQTIAGRSEFYTAYTPYQPEIAQGTLQATYEFQTMISELTGMDVANASVYDGASAVAEAALMALRITKRTQIRIARSVNPDYRGTLQTYLMAHLTEDISILEFDSTKADEDWLKNQEDTQTAAVIIQVPDYFGSLPDLESIQAYCKQTGALFIVSAEPISLGVLPPPGDYGADIVIGDIQPLGNTLSFGGPYGGYIASRTKYARQLPGRLVGRSVEKLGEQAGRPCYTLTLQTREQHIRREKATSNICTNQALNVLKATVYLSLLGPQGLQELAELSAQRAHSLAERLLALPGVKLYQSNPFLFEFTIQFPIPVQKILDTLQHKGILGGIPLEASYPEAKNTLLITCTELTMPDHLDLYVNTVEECLHASR
jgi:glycine dehydrogenase subunit 1